MIPIDGPIRAAAERRSAHDANKQSGRAEVRSARVKKQSGSARIRGSRASGIANFR